MKQIQCLEPRIIANPNLYSLLSVFGNYYVNGVRNVLSKTQRYLCEIRMSDLSFSPYYYNVTSMDLDNYFICDESTGETFPMFIEVPCGHCILCREKKSKDWEARCFLETQTSPSKPLYFTLTYRESDLPVLSYGSYCDITTKKEYIKKYPTLVKKDVQDFMKRFRINLKRSGYCSDGIRYYICGEYGSNYGRPHYHGLFWNLPYIDEKNFNEFRQIFEKSWSHGFITFSPSRGAAGRYVLKYMRKDAENVPKYAQKNFFLSSRKNGGLGAEWLRQNVEFLSSHPELNYLEVNDKFSGKISKFALPEYFKQKLYPSISRLINKPIRDAYKLFTYSLSSLLAVSRDFYDFFCNGKSREGSLYECSSKVIDYFRSFPRYFHPYDFRLPDCRIFRPKYLRNDGFEFLKYIANLNKSLSYLSEHLFKVDNKYIEDKLSLSDIHKVYVDRFVQRCPVVDLNYKAEILQKKLIEGLHKEIF